MINSEKLSEKLLEEKRKYKNKQKQMKRREDIIKKQKTELSLLANTVSCQTKMMQNQAKRYEKAKLVKERYRARANYTE